MAESRDPEPDYSVRRYKVTGRDRDRVQEITTNQDRTYSPPAGVTRRSKRDVESYREDDRSRTTTFDNVDKETRGREIVIRDDRKSRHESPRPRSVNRRTSDDRKRDGALIATGDNEEATLQKVTEYRDDDGVRVVKQFEEHHLDEQGRDVGTFRKETEYYSYEPTPLPVAPLALMAPRTEPPPLFPPPIFPPPRRDPGIVALRDRGQLERRRDDDWLYAGRDARDLDYYPPLLYPPDRYRRRGHPDGLLVNEDRGRRRLEPPEPTVEDPQPPPPRQQPEKSRSFLENGLLLAEGAIAGAGAGAILGSRRGKGGEASDNRMKGVLIGSALGALGSEAIRRAHSAYGDRSDGSRKHLHTGLGVLATALAVAGAAKYMQTSKIEKEEATRGRARTRNSSNDRSSRSPRSPSKEKEKNDSGRSSFIKAALGTAAGASLVQHFRGKSKPRDMSPASRSKDKLRTGAEIVAAGLAGGVASKLWNTHQQKKKNDQKELDSESESDEKSTRSRSQSRSRPRSYYSEPATPAVQSMGLVEYGKDPLAPHTPSYDSAAVEADRQPRGRHSYSDDTDVSEGERMGKADKKRSRSRLRDMAETGLAAGAAAIGIDKFKKRIDGEREKEERLELQRENHRKQEREKKRSRERRKEKQARERERDRERYEEESFDDYPYQHPPSPPTASGGAFWPGAEGHPSGSRFTHHPNTSSSQINLGQNPPYGEDQPYAPNAPYVPNAPYAPNAPYTPGQYNNMPSRPNLPHPPTGDNDHNAPGPEHVSTHVFSASPHMPDVHATGNGEGVFRPSPPPLPSASPVSSSRAGVLAQEPQDGKHNSDAEVQNPEASVLRDSVPGVVGLPRPNPSRNKSVNFIPMSPKSSETFVVHRQLHTEKAKQGSKPNSGDSVDDDLLSDQAYSGLHPADRPRPSRGKQVSHEAGEPDDRLRNRRKSKRTRFSEDIPPSPRPEGSEDEIEELPRRFDKFGQPLDGRPTVRPGMARGGTFDIRPRGQEAWAINGGWAMPGPGDESVMKLVKNVGDVLEGRRSWMGLLGDFIGGPSAEKSNNPRQEEDEADERRRKRNGERSRRN